MKLGKRVISFLLTLSLLSTLCSGIVSADAGKAAKQLFVAENGSDSNAGTMDAPLATLEAARDKIRQMDDKTGGVEVLIRGGTYFRTSAFRLTAEDTGTEAAPVTYKAYGDERVVFTGSMSVSGAQFADVTDPQIVARLPEAAAGHVRMLDLGALGITELGAIQQNGLGWPDTAAPLSIAVDGKKQTLSRYPNDGTLSIASVLKAGFIPRNHYVNFDGSCPGCGGEACKIGKDNWNQQEGGSWTSGNLSEKYELWAQESDIWTQGSYTYAWAEDNLSVQISKYGADGIRFDAAFPAMYGVCGYPLAWFYVYNLLCEIDQPGEYYIDRESGILYLYPESDLANSRVELSLSGDNFITAENVSHVSFERLYFQNSNGNGIQLLDCVDTLVAGCSFYNLAQRAVVIGEVCNQSDYEQVNTGSRGGSGNRVLSCRIDTVGQGGVFVGGGNRYTLTPGNNTVENCEITNFSVVKLTDAPAVEATGCGARILRNRISDGPCVAILYFGNQHLIQGNELYDVCNGTGDTGAIYAGRSWSYQGNLIDNNYIHDIPYHTYGTAAIYLDDMCSGTRITRNLLENCQGYTIHCGGGRDIAYKNNIQINQGAGSGILFDNRGLGWGDTMGVKPNGEMYAEFASLFTDGRFDWEAWTAAYPTLMELLDSETKDIRAVENRTLSDGVAYDVCWEALHPANNRITDNIFVGVPGDSICNAFAADNSWENVLENNHKYAAGTEIGFTDAACRDFSVREDSIIRQKLGNVFFNADEVGLYADAYREEPSGAPAAPELLAPADQAAGVSYMAGVRLTWSETAGAERYIVELAADQNFTNILQVKTTTSTVVRIQQLEAQTTYYWRVTAAASHLGGLSNASTVRAFTTGEPETFSLFEGFGDMTLDGWELSAYARASHTDAQAYSGRYSYVLDESMDFIKYTMPETLQTAVTVWMYDTGSKEDGLDVAVWTIAPEKDTIALCISVAECRDNYCYRVGTQYTDTGIPRTAGWHEITFDYTSGTDCKIILDRQTVWTVEQVSGVQLLQLGDFWSNDGAGDVSGFCFDHVCIGTPQVSPAVRTITLEPGALALETEQEAELKALVESEPDADVELVWSVSPEAVAEVRGSGQTVQIAGRSAGEAVVTVYAKETPAVRASCRVSVTEPRPMPKPAMVKGLTGRSESGCAVFLGWDSAEEAAEVYRRTEDGEWSTIAQNVRGGAFVDEQVAAGETYWYRVAAVNASGAGTPSVAVAVTCEAVAFHEGFEDDGWADGWQVLSDAYDSGRQSSEQFHTGSRSFTCSTGPYSSIEHDFGSEQNQVLRIWVYDATAGDQPEFLCRVSNGDQNIQLGVSSQDFGYYGGRIDPDGFDGALDGFPRTAGWHEFVFDATSGTGIRAMIDGVEALATTDMTAFQRCAIHFSWGRPGEIYFDDISMADMLEAVVQASPNAEAAAEKIEAIGTVSAQSGAAIEAARAAYEALTDEEKAAMPNEAALLAAEDAYREITSHRGSDPIKSDAANVQVYDTTGGSVRVTPRAPKTGDIVTVTLTPDPGCHAAAPVIKDQSGALVTVFRGGTEGSSFIMPEGKVTVRGVFVGDTATEFRDVRAGSCYADAIAWAAASGLTNGVGEDCFEPETVCTRAQLVTFLWRAAGSPAAGGTESAFLDVAPDSFYGNAVRWAAGARIVNGIGETAFCPAACVTRGQTVTMLSRFAQEEGRGAAQPFCDVPAGAYYAGAVQWAVENHITTGVDATHFQPDGGCTRAQGALFLYRLFVR